MQNPNSIYNKLQRRKRQLEVALHLSKDGNKKFMTYKDIMNHETFFLSDGKVSEYNCYRYRGNPVELTEEELQTINEIK